MASGLRAATAVVQPRIPLAIVLTSFDPGGTERQMTELIRRLDTSRFEVHVACFRRSGQWLPRVERAAASVSEFPLRSFRHRSTLTQLIRFVRWCRTHRIAVLQACDFYANVFGLIGGTLARVPLRIASRRDILLPQRTSGQRRLQRLVYRLAHRVVANSEAAADQLRQEGVPDPALIVVPNGIDLARYEPAPLRTEPRIVTTVANLRGEKGHDVLLRAAAIVTAQAPEVRFRIVGDGPMRSRLSSIAVELGIAHVVEFLGHQEDVPEVLRDSDVFVLPSRTEAFPNALVEAMAAGLPVVASDTGGIPELVTHDRNGLLVPVGDHTLMAAAILSVLRDRSRAGALASAARQTIEARYSFHRMVQSFESLYLLHQPASALPLSNGLPIDAGQPR
jgi:glycosyltransferase involved in cell wall biosynthesis